MTIHDVYKVFMDRFRSKRMTAFAEMFGVSSETQIIDVGGDRAIWDYIRAEPQVTMVNIRCAEWRDGRFRMVRGDGTNLQFGDAEFDICFSNSVIEHVGDAEAQCAFSNEIRRVAKRYYVQTSNRAFFIEPHLIAPFIHWLPVRVQRKLARNFTLRGLMTRPTQAYIDRFLAETRLLTECDMRSLFPDATILREKFLFFTKSLIAVRL